jgi:hypothetical protein
MRPPVEQDVVDRDFAAIRAMLDEATIATAQAAGRAMPQEQAIAEALGIEAELRHGTLAAARL